jgi:protein disulfide-isomerase
MRSRSTPHSSTLKPVIAAILGALIAAASSSAADSTVPKPVAQASTDRENPAGSNKRSGIWQTDYKQALAEAAIEKKQVLLDFTGSDWCPYCVQMDKEVLNQPDFKTFAANKLILVKLDFPRRKQIPPAEAQQNQKLQEEFAIEGFPTYVLLDPAGKELRRQVGYLEGGPGEFIKWAQAGN